MHMFYQLNDLMQDTKSIFLQVSQALLNKTFKFINSSLEEWNTTMGTDSWTKQRYPFSL